MFPLLIIASLLSFALAQLLSLRPPQSLLSNELVEHAPPQHHRQHTQYRHYVPPPPQPETDLFDSVDLLDIILLASVDGKFHALNRTSGHILWSMSPYPSSNPNSSLPPRPSALSPLVRTNHVEYDPETTDDTSPQEMYIIEPQSGDIYVMPNPSSPLQRFPFTMQELVDMSPFSFSGEEDGRVFVGKKETSLLVVELETGKIKATLNSECPWDQFEELRKDKMDELDLDELEENEPQKPPTTDVYIGRTDYHVSIITRSNPSSTNFHRHSHGASNLVQNLSFSTYGPNNQDNHMQSLYRRTEDNAYVQPLPSGEIMSFRAKSSIDPVGPRTSMNHDPLWAHPGFNEPIVAVFDVLKKKATATSTLGGSTHPFVLLQPRPKIEDLIPNLPAAITDNLLTAHVGLVSETGSLFAMSPQNFPLVVFGRNDGEKRSIGSGKNTGGRGSSRVKSGKGTDHDWEEGNEPTTVDDLTRLRKLREAEQVEEEEKVLQCHDRVMNDRRCLVGVRRMELDMSDGRETRMKRLLDASPSAMEYEDYRRFVGPHLPLPRESETVNESANVEEAGPLTIDPPREASSVHPGRMWETLGATIILGFITFWVLTRGATWRKTLGIKSQSRSFPVPEPTPAPAAQTQDESANVVPEIITEPDVPTPIPSTPAPSTSKLNATPVVTTPSTPAPGTPMTGPLVSTTWDETDREDLDGTNTDAEEFVVDPGSNGAPPAPVAAVDAARKKKTRRGKRGVKKSKNSSSSGDAGDPTTKMNGNAKAGNGNSKEKEKEEGEVEEAPMQAQTPPSSLIVTSTIKPSIAPSPSLTVSDTVLGYGSHGTVVFRGSLQGRAVAVKRLLADFVTLASREVSILQESDDHPNVIRYYYQEAQAGFLYIALELCPASLADIIEAPDRDAWRDIAVNFDPKRALRQITNGLRHLHGLKLVHRDIKPQNILVSTKGSAASSKPGSSSSAMRGTNYRMLISDFGLCKKLDVDQTSFLPTANGMMAAGTVGWRAPEILSGEVKLNEFADDQSQSSRGSTATIQGNASTSSTSSNNSAKARTRLTKSVDIFALGCLYYYTLTGGGHPFGDRYEREVNIMKNAKNLDLLERFGEEGTEAVNLIERMLDPLPSGRPDTMSCLLHPFFWDSSRRLNFLQDASDRFEIMCRDPKDPDLLALEEGALGVVGNDWHSRLDKIFIENLGKFRKYDGRSVQDLLRALRNKKHHYQDIPDNVKRHLGPMPEGFLAYFTRRFPNLFLHVHRVVKETGLAEESMFRSYFELPDS